jgi:hypothetical protein
LFLARIGLKFRITLIREAWMLVTKQKSRLQTFYATMVVTRVEEWCVEAETPEEARALLAGGQGHRCQLGDCVHLELEAMDDTAS